MYYNVYHTAKNCMVPNRAKNITRFRLKHLSSRTDVYTIGANTVQVYLYQGEGRGLNAG